MRRYVCAKFHCPSEVLGNLYSSVLSTEHRKMSLYALTKKTFLQSAWRVWQCQVLTW